MMGASLSVRSVLNVAVFSFLVFGLAAHVSAADRFFVSDQVSKRVFKYDDSLAHSSDWATAVSNGTPDDVYITDSEAYVLDSSARKVFRYDHAGGNVAESLVFKVPGDSTAANIGTPVGMSVDPLGNEMWITDTSKKLYRYSLSGAFGAGTSVNALNQYNLQTANTTPQGLSLDANYVYVLDRNQSRLYRYSRSNPTAAHTPSRKLRTEDGTKLLLPEGMAVAGDFLFVLDNDNGGKVYRYSMFNVFLDPTEENADESFTLAPGNANPFGIGVDKSRVAISITPSTVGPTNIDSVSFDVVFDEPMFNFNDAADLVVTHNGTASTGVTVTGSGSAYTVTVDGLSGDGTFTLAVNTESDIQNVDGGSLLWSAVSPAVLIDNTAPVVQALSPVSGTEVDVTFTELNGMSADATLPATYTGSELGLGTLLPNPSTVSHLGNNVYRLSWAAGGANNGQTLTITVNPALTDAAGNPIASGLNTASATAVPVTLSGFSIE